jgi:hypothetical protein
MTSIETIQKKVWLSEKEAIEYTGIKVDTLRSLRTKGSLMGEKLPYRKVSNRILYKRKEIDEYFDKHKPGS